FFMRHFERQADLYSAVVMGGPRQTISSLEKIALLSGKIRALPSWHHFSIGQRVDYLWRFLKEPGLVKRHNRFMAFSLGLYLAAVIGLGYLVNYSPLKKDFTEGYLVKVLHHQLKEEPDNVLLYKELARVYHGMGNEREAMKAYEMIITLDPGHSAVAMNNLAWLLATTSEKGLRDRERALILAKKAVNLERSPMFLDTLAEALQANGFAAESIATIQEAIALARENQDYYQGQLEKFKKGTAP
ncbi:MAG: peptidase M48 Ste24p, partial [Pseudomonadota bacterium]